MLTAPGFSGEGWPPLTSQPYVVNERDIAIEAWNDPVRGAVSWRTLLSADRSPSRALTLGVAEVTRQAGTDGRLHRHAQAEAYYILSGRGIIHIILSGRGIIHIDGEERPLSPGTVAFIPGGAWHAARAVGAEPLRLLYVFAANSFDEIVYEFQAAEGG
jgi:mannose-6-phosphate isomerase-like protein (cupin superfamily)